MSSYNKICSECNQEYTDVWINKWYKPCNSKHFQNDFNKWTSGNDNIDKFIQDALLNANNKWEVIEWIPYDRFKDVKQIGKGGFGTIHCARWIDGYIEKWDIENQQPRQYQDEDEEVGKEVALKKFDNFVNLNNVLNEMAIHLKTRTGLSSIRFYGITQDPETHSYIMNIHKLDIVHQDFHPGNILSSNFKSDLQISDFGLSKLIGANPNNSEKKNIFGVLPYISPEVLSGEEFTKAADVYSFGMIAYEIVTGFPPYSDIPHDKDLAWKICNGLRPKIPFQTPKLITRMIMRCWDARVTHRPTFEELRDELYKYYDDYLEKGKNKDSEIVIQIKKAEEFSENQNHGLGSIWKSISRILAHWREESTNMRTKETQSPLNYQTHPEAIYTSRLINYSCLPKPKNEEIFEKELEELTKSTSASSAVASKLHVPDF
ncbi:hypothetical protein Glove_313g65 [Diversispora epigaea]|uniref:Protein kinase domain-containing protein n=1 Tax=Diversispora epigaea TaxID=1348612 RepID=A0A397HRJ4_9GLOM|nr:hypothetical protein Glove_313g65 [Diversispora epigaea]